MMMTVQTIDLTELYQPHARQREAHGARERYILMGGAVRGGKTYWLCNEAIQLSLDHPGNRGYLCRNEFTAFKRSTWLTFQRFLIPDLIRRHHMTDSFIELINGSVIYYGGLGSGDTGFNRLKSTEWGWVAIDQVEEASEDVWNMLLTRMAHTLPNGDRPRYKILATANPWPGWVRDRFVQQTLPNHRFVQSLPSDNPYLPPGYEEELREQLPPELVKALLEGDWDVVRGANFLIPYPGIVAAQDRELTEDYSLGLTFGVDVARFGDDKTVVAARRGQKILWLEEWIKKDLVETTDMITALMRRFLPDHVVVDAVGVGAGVYDNLVHYEEWGEIETPDGLEPYRPKFTAYEAGTAARNTLRFANRKAEDFLGLAQRFEDGEIDIPPDQELRTQLSAIKYDVNTKNQLKIESKEEMKRRGMKSPDKAEAVLHSFSPYEGSGFWFPED
jgi:hypothetical protein